MHTLKTMAALTLLATTAIAAPMATAQSLTSQERQYVNLLDDEEFEKANFYVSQGLVNPASLSTGKSLLYYLFPANYGNLE
ncbi:hypothetical protein [Henriciella litoralis]|uniref:hypothetical protein n=1 Tax=Henriciella litoralis TaxID=568102 RepID=UPI00111BF7C3|nr:hypothetical protein [Henriciella litoralis]